MITNHQSGTRIDEIATGIYRINTPLALPGEVGFSFNQYLIVDDAPMLFHSGMRRLFPLVSEAIRAVMPVERLRYVGLSHFEADECGALNEFLAAAPNAVRLTKLAINRSFDAMGLRNALASALELDLYIEAAGGTKRAEFDRIRREDGLKAALEWRDKQQG